MSKANNNKTKKSGLRNMSPRTKWIITGVLFALAVLTVILSWQGGLFNFRTPIKSNDTDIAAAATPTPSDDANTASATQYKIFVSASNGGTVSPEGSSVVSEWENLTVSITPNEGYLISSITVDGESVSVTESYTFSYVSADHTLIVAFEKEPEPTPSPTVEPTSTPVTSPAP